MGFRPATTSQPKGSLFIACPQSDGTAAEISIPTLVDARSSNDATTLNKATFLQPCTDPRSGATYSLNAGAAATAVGGIAVNGSQLLISYYGMYDPDYTQQASHYVKSSLTLSAPDAKGPYAVSQKPVITNGTVGYFRSNGDYST